MRECERVCGGRGGRSGCGVEYVVGICVWGLVSVCAVSAVSAVSAVCAAGAASATGAVGAGGRNGAVGSGGRWWARCALVGSVC